MYAELGDKAGSIRMNGTLKDKLTRLKMRKRKGSGASRTLLTCVAAAALGAANLQSATAESPSSTRSPSYQVSRVQYLGRAAFRLTNGGNEAVVVPSLGRVMRYGPIGGTNLLWNSPQTSFKAGEWANWGGDKAWPAPQSAWPLSLGAQTWPPHPSWDGAAQSSRVLPNGHVQTTSGIWPVLGCRIVREFWFDTNGDFIIQQTAEKVSGAPVQMSIWSVTQTAPDVVFVPTNPNSPYKNNFYWFGGVPETQNVSPIDDKLLQIVPVFKGNYKIGVDAPVSAVAMRKGDILFTQRSAKPSGDYPDGASGAGFPIEIFDSGGIFDNGAVASHYVELEILGPLRVFHVGTKWTHTVRWSLQQLPPNANEATVQETVRGLLQPVPEISTK